MVVVNENVRVSVGEKMAMVVGLYWLQFVPKFDDPTLPRIPVYYPVFVPRGITSQKELLEITQIVLRLGEREFRPETARVWTDAEVGVIQTPPENAAVAWFIFQIPRELAHVRFEALISHFQPNFQYEGKTIAPLLPWLPNLEPLRENLELLDKDFVVTVEALPPVKLLRLTSNEKVESDSATQFVVHPRHRETITAAAIIPPSPSTEKKRATD